jgi:hypothetical protein
MNVSRSIETSSNTSVIIKEAEPSHDPVSGVGCSDHRPLGRAVWEANFTGSFEPVALIESPVLWSGGLKKSDSLAFITDVQHCGEQGSSYASPSLFGRNGHEP